MTPPPIPTVVVITLFPEIFTQGPLQVSLVGKAQKEGKWRLKVVNLRLHGLGRHQTVDEAVYGGGAGMILRPDVLHSALQEAAEGLVNPKVIYLSPRGIPLRQKHLQQWHQEPRDKILICGRYEGVDQRVLDHWAAEEISVGDFVVCGGEIPALLVLEGYIRLLEGVVGNAESLETESFQHGLLEHSHYTRPAVWNGYTVPDILLSGHHQHIQDWREEQSRHLTQKRRPDLWHTHENPVKLDPIESR